MIVESECNEDLTSILHGTADARDLMILRVRLMPLQTQVVLDIAAEDAEVAEALGGIQGALLANGRVRVPGNEEHDPEPAIVETGMNITYVLSWLRQEENQYLSCPPEIAREFEPRLKALIGYTIGNGGLGYFSPAQPSRGHIDTLPPEAAVSKESGESGLTNQLATEQATF